MEPRRIDPGTFEFIGLFAVSIFAILAAFYLVQIFLTWNRAKIPAPAYTRSGVEGKISLFFALKHFDGGFQNTIWTFLILGIFLPVVLTSLSDVVPLLEPTNKADERQFSKTLYFVYISIISVIITLEFSYIQNLRNSASQWTPFLLVALVLDLTALLVFIFGIKHPETWATEPAFFTQLMMFITSVAALFSSFLILILSRTAGALHDRQIEFPIIEDWEDQHREDQENMKTRDAVN